METDSPAPERARGFTEFRIAVTEIRCRTCHVWVARGASHVCKVRGSSPRA